MRQLLALAFGLAASSLGHAQRLTACEEALPRSYPTSHGFYTFLWENDVTGGTDKNYTNGNAYSFSSLPRPLQSATGALARSLLGADCESVLFYTLGLSQSMYTPEDREATEPLPDEHPYAGWRSAEYAITVARASSALIGVTDAPRDWSTLSLQLGVVGPLARQQQLQNRFHDLIDDIRLGGWDNQLKNEPALLLSYDRRWQQAMITGASGRSADLVPGFGAAVGNVLLQASAGFTARFGVHLAESDLPTRIRPGATGTSVSFAKDRAAWYLFAGIEGRAVARNIFLDGNTFQESLRVEKRPTVTDLQWGAVLRLRGLQASYTFVTRSEEFLTQNGPHRFGSLTLTWRL